eukprot:m.31002 g.31002  ORF g.31002 m.31002 type:complete len:137 (+) comp13920_c0_seq2:188-598(+)
MKIYEFRTAMSENVPCRRASVVILVLISAVVQLCHGSKHIALDNGVTLTIDVATSTSFRLGVTVGSQGGKRSLPSPSLNPETGPAASSSITIGEKSGLKTSFGSLVADKTGTFELRDVCDPPVLLVWCTTLGCVTP